MHYKDGHTIRSNVPNQAQRLIAWSDGPNRQTVLFIRRDEFDIVLSPGFVVRIAGLTDQRTTGLIVISLQSGTPHTKRPRESGKRGARCICSQHFTYFHPIRRRPGSGEQLHCGVRELLHGGKRTLDQRDFKLFVHRLRPTDSTQFRDKGRCTVSELTYH